MLQQNDIETSL